MKFEINDYNGKGRKVYVHNGRGKLMGGVHEVGRQKQEPRYYYFGYGGNWVSRSCTAIGKAHYSTLDRLFQEVEGK